jgi:hypothetical protein
MSGILEALAVKEDGKDPLVAAVRRQVTDTSILHHYFVS